MNKPRMTMSELRRRAGQASPASTTTLPGSGENAVLSTTAVHDTLNQQVGQLDLGLIGNFRNRLFQRKQDGQMQRTLTQARAEQATALMLERLQGEVQILRTRFKQDFSDRIAALAESAAASQIMAMRKLHALENEARNFVMEDLKRELDGLQEMLARGVMDEESFDAECAFRMARYDDLKARFSALLDGYLATVQNTYQGNGH